MSPASERHARVSELFQAAAELPPQDRDAFLEIECGDDQSLRREVEALLEADARTFTFIERPIAELPADLLAEGDEEDFAGRTFGAYRVIREIGRGGLGAVYLAARADEQFQKQVAIKVVKRGLDTDDILRRFRAERQILAQLEHPNIARLIDAGSTEEGLPYFVMEYVEGESITSYCEVHRLSTTERLELFRLVCGAVTYAHQHLVIHRDIKPSNILVTGDSESLREGGGVPKLLDFGIAKVLHAEDPLAALTMTGVRVMTPEYASPEQVRGLPVSTATDVYSLGVLLYELLTGAKPYRRTSHTSEELSRAITDQIPERPSTAVERSASFQLASQSNLKSCATSLRGDLDNIVLMALRKEPERRYASVERFSEDIRRHLAGLPVSAHKDTLQYRTSKFIRRNKAVVLGAVLLLLAILAGITGTLWQSHAAQAQRVKAEKRFNDVRKLANSNLFDVYPEVENLAGSLKARESILQNALQYLDSLAQEASDDLGLQSELASGYEKVGDVQGSLKNSNLGKTKAGLETYRKASVLRAAVLAAHPNDLEAKEKLAANNYTIARTLWMDSQTKEAEDEFEKTLRLQRELVATKPDSPALKDKLAVTLIDYAAIPAFNAQSEKALILLNEALTIADQLRAKDPGNTTFKKTKARLLRLLSNPKSALADYAGGLKDLETALVLSKEVAQQFPDDFRAQRAVWLTETMTCELFIDQGAGAQAVEVGLRTIAFPKRALANEPENGVVAYDLAISYFNLARAHRLAGNFTETIAQADAAIEVMSKLSAKSPDDDDYKRNLAIYKTEKARAQIALRQSDEAIAALRSAEEILQPIVAADPKSATNHGDLGMAYQLQAQAHHQKGNDREAARLVDKAIEIAQRLKDLKSSRASEKDLLAELEKEKTDYNR